MARSSPKSGISRRRQTGGCSPLAELEWPGYSTIQIRWKLYPHDRSFWTGFYYQFNLFYRKQHTTLQIPFVKSLEFGCSTYTLGLSIQSAPTKQCIVFFPATSSLLCCLSESSSGTFYALVLADLQNLAMLQTTSTDTDHKELKTDSTALHGSTPSTPQTGVARELFPIMWTGSPLVVIT